jgi:hypothetical protein
VACPKTNLEMPRAEENERMHRCGSKRLRRTQREQAKEGRPFSKRSKAVRRAVPRNLKTACGWPVVFRLLPLVLAQIAAPSRSFLVPSGGSSSIRRAGENTGGPPHWQRLTLNCIACTR